VATYVLVHGAGHGGWCWQRVAPILRSAGHEVYTPTMTGLGERSHLLSPDVDLELHITDIANVLSYEDLHGVILVGHSYGGTVIRGAANQALDRVGHLVYLDASLLADGESAAEDSPGWMEAVHASAKVVDGVELVLFPDPEPSNCFGITDPADIDWMKPKLTPHPWICFSQHISLPNEEAINKISKTIVNCTSTLSIRHPDRIQQVLTGERVWEIDTAHDLMISEPEALAEMLLRVASV
jgi:pimeloyl-ACP methyl ester carboxylesterase